MRVLKCLCVLTSHTHTIVRSSNVCIWVNCTRNTYIASARGVLNNPFATTPAEAPTRFSRVDTLEWHTWLPLPLMLMLSVCSPSTSSSIQTCACHEEVVLVFLRVVPYLFGNLLLWICAICAGGYASCPQRNAHVRVHLRWCSPENYTLHQCNMYTHSEDCIFTNCTSCPNIT